MKGLKKAASSAKGKYSYPFDELTFNYLTDHGITYMVMADCMYGRRLPFVYLEKLKDLFVDKYGARSLESLQANALSQEFGPLMKELMEFSMHNSDEMKQLAKLKAQVLEVQSALTNNIEQVRKAYKAPMWRRIVFHKKQADQSAQQYAGLYCVCSSWRC
ncbi:hypothetical protein CLOP_g5052 [Closterium sp. NIES-67]|nr:hypothetical protein CLOP_g5052 [Closterium sp. NIES-67]